MAWDEKTNDFSNMCLVSLDGTRVSAGFPVAVNGNGVPLISDENGILWVRDSGIVPPPPAGLSYFDNDGAFAGDNDWQVKGSAGTLSRIYGFKTGAGTEFIQGYDLAAGAIGAAIPLFNFPVDAGGSFSLNFASPRAFAAGIRVVLSAASASFVAGTSTGWLNAEFT